MSKLGGQTFEQSAASGMPFLVSVTKLARANDR
jgi:hypothetical protein